MKAAHRSGLFSALNFSLVSAQFVNDLLSSFIAHPSSLIPHPCLSVAFISRIVRLNRRVAV